LLLEQIGIDYHSLSEEEQGNVRLGLGYLNAGLPWPFEDDLEGIFVDYAGKPGKSFKDMAELRAVHPQLVDNG